MIPDKECDLLGHVLVPRKESMKGLIDRWIERTRQTLSIVSAEQRGRGGSNCKSEV